MNVLKRIGIFWFGLWLVSVPLDTAMAQNAKKDVAAGKMAMAQLTDTERAQLKAFSDRVKEYQAMEKKLPADKLSPTANVQQLDQQRQTLREALQQARPNAKQGDIFTPDVAPVFRKLFRSTLTGPAGKKIRASLNHAEPIGPRDLKVNGVYPNLAGQPLQSVPPTLLMNLPVLPKGLEYRLVDHAVVLRDTDANMVVDFLTDALP